MSAARKHRAWTITLRGRVVRAQFSADGRCRLTVWNEATGQPIICARAEIVVDPAAPDPAVLARVERDSGVRRVELEAALRHFVRNPWAAE